MEKGKRKLRKTAKIVIASVILLILLVVGVLVYVALTGKGNVPGITSKATTISIYTDGDVVKTELNSDKKDVLDTYKCEDSNCKAYGTDKDSKSVIIYDKEYFIYDYSNKNKTTLNIDKKDYKDIIIAKDNVAVKENDKFALYDYKNNKYISEAIYDGILNKDDIYGAYYYSSKYNEKLDIYENNEKTKEYKHCVKLENYTDKLYCSEHVDGKITDEEVDAVIDKTLSQYPDLNDVRLFTIKTGIETVGLPYFWGGGHGSLENTIYTAENSWGIKYCTVGASGFKSQVAGGSYPCGLDCSGYVRWVYYEATGLDIMGKGVSVIGGRFRHPDYTQINEEELIPGDLIMDKDHVTIYLYKNEEGQNVSVHSSFNHLKVEVSHYNKGCEYFRLNMWK